MTTPYVCPHTHALSVAKSLRKNGVRLSLPKCQDVVATMLGHASFSALAVASMTKRSVPDELVDQSVAASRRSLQVRALSAAGVEDAQDIVDVVRPTMSPSHAPVPSGLPKGMNPYARLVGEDGFFSFPTPYREHDEARYATPDHGAYVHVEAWRGTGTMTVVSRQNVSETYFDVHPYAATFRDGEGNVLGFVQGHVFAPCHEWCGDGELERSLTGLLENRYDGMMARAHSTIGDAAFAVVGYAERSMTRTSPGVGVDMLAACLAALARLFPALACDGNPLRLAIDTALRQHAVHADSSSEEWAYLDARDARKVKGAYVRETRRLRKALDALEKGYAARVQGGQVEVESVFDSLADVAYEDLLNFRLDRRSVDEFIACDPDEPDLAELERMIPDVGSIHDDKVEDVVRIALEDCVDGHDAALVATGNEGEARRVSRFFVGLEEAKVGMPEGWCLGFVGHVLVVEDDGSLRLVEETHFLSNERHYGLGDRKEVTLLNLVTVGVRIAYAGAFRHPVFDGRPVRERGRREVAAPVPATLSAAQVAEAWSLCRRPDEDPDEYAPSTLDVVVAHDAESSDTVH